MSSGIYKRIISTIERWPVDKNKPGRDLGQYLRDYINQANKEGKFLGKEQYWDQQYLALQRLINNEHGNKYVRGLSSSAMGLSAEQCNLALTKEYLQLFEQEHTSIFKKIFKFKKTNNA